MSDGNTYFHGVLLSLALGALVGLVRQWADQHEKPEAEPAAGLRTYALWSLIGYIVAILSPDPGGALFVTAFGALTAVLIVLAWRRYGEDRSGMGATSIAAALITFLAGALVAWKGIVEATSVVAGTMILIGSKSYIHRWTERLTREDIFLFLQFVAVSALILPVLPNEGYGPLGALNPFKIWLVVVLISGMGFVGYAMVRWVGTQRGLLLTSIAGGLASSTATTLAFSRSSRHSPELAPALGIGIVVASVFMVARVWVLILALNPILATAVALPFCVMILPATVHLAWRHFRRRGEAPAVETPALRNPLSLRIAIKFALIYALVALLVRISQEYGGPGSFYPLAFISGLTQMDAIALSLANEFGANRIPLALAAQGVVIGVVANTLFKYGWALVAGDKRLRWPLTLGMVPMAAAGCFGIWLVDWGIRLVA